ncbi:peptidylprolyl isomerase [Pontixanthobacter aquaemixtae]|uniref:Parvulin-like PPIase n=1 Tax=Pontixanthobacter aquaemixtae TaxID=1958940 RepID=A0A844ZTI9_9SPHN|nr:peptidylprolyl isomerase [Pontixanthobacter aquaemixtae]MXO90316.1 peptidylprolyl isomerase [Pontixanthobacter aquaemixtae]
MIQFFRKFFQSKVGIAVTLAFLGLIAFAFASADVSSTGTFGGVSGGDRVAVVGDEKISTSDLSRAVNNAVDSMRQQNPTISMEAFLEQDGLEQVLDQVLERAAISGFADKYGLRAGTNLVNSEIISSPAFRGADGNFSEESYRQFLTLRRLNDTIVREDLRSGLLERQVIIPSGLGSVAPDKFASRYAALLKETRKGSISIVPSSAFAPSKDPSDAQLKAFYEESKGDYIRPERRTIRYITFGDNELGKLPAPTEQEIAANYEENREQFAASEERTITQMIVPTKQAADAVRNRVQGGATLEVAAREAGLTTAKLGPVSRSDYASQSSAAVAKAVFEANNKAIAVPARSGLGFHVVRIDAIDRQPGKNLDQARAEITAALREQKRRAALSDLAARIEEQVDDRVSLTDIAAELKVDIATTKPVTGAGTVYENPQEQVPQILAPALQSAFQMEESRPQLAEIVPGQTFLVYEASDITRSAAAPLAEIRTRVVDAWKLSEGSKGAKAAVDRIMKRIAEGVAVAGAVAAEKSQSRFPPVDEINLNREQLVALGGNVPAPLALLFSMAEGTTKKLEAPNNAGWFVVQLEDIEEGTISKEDELFTQTKQSLGPMLGSEYSEQLRSAVLTEIGTETNEAAIEAVRKQLAGEN